MTTNLGAADLSTKSQVLLLCLNFPGLFRQPLFVQDKLICLVQLADIILSLPLDFETGRAARAQEARRTFSSTAWSKSVAPT